MPRGNLETVYPLALVLSSVRRHLNHHRYGDAFITMRKHRINLNLIYDHAPEVINNLFASVFQIWKNFRCFWNM